MKKSFSTFALFSLLITLSCNSAEEKDQGDQKANTKKEQINKDSVSTETLETVVNIDPINHASFVLTINNVVIYNDPVGNQEAYANNAQPDLILLSDIHQDHFNEETLEAIISENTQIIAPQAVADMMNDNLLAHTTVYDNGDQKEVKINNTKLQIKALPMYNLREEAAHFHTKGRGNGYLISAGGQRIYISGDTEDIPEMRNLENIDIAFVCMNLPYTMPVEKAADAVLDFAPQKVYPYHYRGTEGLSDVEKFKKIVNEGNSNIEVVQLNWYTKQ